MLYCKYIVLNIKSIISIYHMIIGKRPIIIYKYIIILYHKLYTI